MTVAARKRRTLIAAIVGLNLTIVDETIVFLALPAINRDLHVSLSGQAWRRRAGGSVERQTSSVGYRPVLVALGWRREDADWVDALFSNSGYSGCGRVFGGPYSNNGANFWSKRPGGYSRGYKSG